MAMAVMPRRSINLPCGVDMTRSSRDGMPTVRERRVSAEGPFGASPVGIAGLNPATANQLPGAAHDKGDAS